MNRKYRKRKNYNRTIFLCNCILGTALVIVMAVHWLPDKARELKIRMGVETENKNSKEKKAQTENEQKDKAEVKQPPDENPNIRVVLMTNGYKGIAHSKVELSSDSGLIITYGDGTSKEGKALNVEPKDNMFKKGKIQIRAKKGGVTLNSLKRGYGTPSYEGTVELYREKKGIVIINELPVESYLCRVVPSEMSASYELEALKAQAVCARSYAIRQMESYGYPKYKAHVNDSTDYQVYGNSKPAESAKTAVYETAGETVQYNGKTVPTYYYSTSCGTTTNVEAWGTKPSKKNGYLKAVEVKDEAGDYEKELPWYRWSAEVSESEMTESLKKYTKKKIGKIKDVKITKQGPGDVVLQLKAVGEKGSVTIETENKIRTALAGNYKIQRQDGSETNCGALLPSGFFTIKKKGKSFVIEGGGFGHGIG
ncbi:MAG: SpoIID/LytB domain-containing protein, partial [Lachnospiraceae bacterium]|nr:SpoIID/LytB domain-containing protein [Lachnospiraceae bacterium]